MSQSFVANFPSMALLVLAKGALISLAALGVVSALRRSSAASRHLVLSLAAAALLVIPLVTAVLPCWNLPVLPRMQSPTAQGSMSGPVTPSLFPLLPLAISSFLLLRLFVSIHGLARLRAGSRPGPEKRQALLDEERERLGIARPVLLAVSPAVAMPVTFGWRRPVVLIPEAALDWEEQPLREALVHELSHVRRGDWPVQMIARAACAVHWLNPFVWMLGRRLLLEAELACDDQVLRAGTSAEGYAERLVALARQARESSRRPASAMAFARSSGLARRVTAILDSGRRRGKPGRGAITGAVAVALLFLLVVSQARLVQAESPARPEIQPRQQEAVPVPDEAVAQDIPAMPEEEAIEDGVREGVNRDSVQDGARGGVDEGRQEAQPGPAADPGGPSDPVPAKPLPAASRIYAETLQRLLTGNYAGPLSPPPGEGC